MSLDAIQSSLSAPLLALQDLIHQEAVDSKRPKLAANKISWWTDVLRVRGSAIPNVWRPTLYLTVWATVVAVADFEYHKEWRLSNGVLPLLSVVVGLMLVFRNTTAFSRWDEGRKLFTSLTSTTRSLTRSIWISVGAAPARPSASSSTAGAHPDHPRPSEAEHRRKVRALRLVVAFVVASKRHIQGEYGVDWEDLKALLPPGFYATEETPGFGYGSADADRDRPPSSFGSAAAKPTDDPGAPAEGAAKETFRHPTSPSSPRRIKRPWESQRAEIDENAPLLSPSFSRSSFLSRASSAPTVKSSPRATSLFRRRSKQPTGVDAGDAERQGRGGGEEEGIDEVVHDYLSRPSLPLPLVIAHQIHLYLASCKSKGLLESVGPAGYNAMTSSLASMTDSFSQISAISSLGIPAIYSIHMKQCTTMYLLALPLTLLDLGWTLIPIVTIVAFTLMGIEALARECEDPFGADPSDLPLDLLSAELRSEMEHMVARLGASTDELMI